MKRQYRTMYTLYFRDINVEWKNIQDEKAMTRVIFKKFYGQRVTMDRIESFIWMETPFVYRKTPLSVLDKTGRITHVYPEDPKRRKGTFANVKEIKFDKFRYNNVFILLY